MVHAEWERCAAVAAAVTRREAVCAAAEAEAAQGEQDREARWLHHAAEGGQSVKVTALLEEGHDPTRRLGLGLGLGLGSGLGVGVGVGGGGGCCGGDSRAARRGGGRGGVHIPYRGGAATPIVGVGGGGGAHFRCRYQ